MELGHDNLILSLFPGVGLLDRAFEGQGWCVVRGPDLLWGGDVRQFEPQRGHFWGVIGGPPCQDFSGLRRSAPSGHGQAMLGEFRRCVLTAEPEWWLMENVARVPDLLIEGYVRQRLDVNQGWFGDRRVTRLRHIQFGSRSGRLLDVPRGSCDPAAAGAAVASDSRSLDELKRLQGLPADFDLPGFTVAAKKRAIGNGVPLSMGRALAQAVAEAFACDAPDGHASICHGVADGVTEPGSVTNARSVTRPVTLQRTFDGEVTRPDVCRCGCGRPVGQGNKYASVACRKRAQRKRDRAQGRLRVHP